MLSLPSTPRYVFGFVAPLEPGIIGVESLLVGSKQSPARRLGHVVQGREALLSLCLLVSLRQLLEPLVVDPGPPLALHLELREATGEGAAVA